MKRYIYIRPPSAPMEERALDQAVGRNAGSFPLELCFPLLETELDNTPSQSASQTTDKTADNPIRTIGKWEKLCHMLELCQTYN